MSKVIVTSGCYLLTRCGKFHGPMRYIGEGMFASGAYLCDKEGIDHTSKSSDNAKKKFEFAGDL